MLSQDNIVMVLTDEARLATDSAQRKNILYVQFMSVGLLVVGGAAALAHSTGREIVLLLAPAVLTILITLSIQNTADAIAFNVYHRKIQDMLNEHITAPNNQLAYHQVINGRNYYSMLPGQALTAILVITSYVVGWFTVLHVKHYEALAFVYFSAVQLFGALTLVAGAYDLLNAETEAEKAYAKAKEYGETSNKSRPRRGPIGRH